MSGADARELTCQEVVELVNEYLGDALSDAERVRFEAHLSTCEPCTAYLGQMRSTIEVTGRLDDRDLPGEVKRDLLAAFRRWKR